MLLMYSVSSGEILLALYTHTHTHTHHTHTHTHTQIHLWMTAELRSQQCRCVQIGCRPHYHIFIIIIELYPVGSVVYCLLFLKVAIHLIGMVVSE